MRRVASMLFVTALLLPMLCRGAEPPDRPATAASARASGPASAPRPPSRMRLDQRLVSEGLCPSRERAQALILAGEVTVAGQVVTKSGAQVAAAQPVAVRRDPLPYVSRGGLKLRRALEAIRAGGWAGTVWNETANGRAMTVPVVESDFAPSFFLSRYGGLAGLVLVGGQALFVALMVIIANRALNRGWSSDNRPTMVAGFVYFFLYGGAALLSARFLVSWGTNLGFLPVMGQPMPLLSAAGSHLVLSVLPIVALAVVVEEKGRDNSS